MRIWFSGPRIMGIRPGVSFNANELFKPKKARPETPAAAAVGGFIYLLCAIVFVVAVIMISVAHAGDDANAKQHLKELRQLDTLRDQCTQTISDAQRNDNVWPDNATVSMQDCRDLAMKQINLGQKLIEDSQGDD